MEAAQADTRELLEFAAELTGVSRPIIRQYFNHPGLEVEQKNDRTVVTRADREAEAAMRKRIRARHPSHGILGEEFGEENPGAEYIWVLDPIDGTVSFVHGCPLFGTLVGLLRAGQPVVGAIDLPALGRLLLGDGRSTTLNGRPVRVRETPRIEEATVLVTDVRLVSPDWDRGCFDRLVERAGTVRGWGDCYGYALVAAGLADIMLDPVLSPWDILPLIPVIRGAGGVISDWRGEDAVRGRSGVAASPGLHREVIDVLNGR